MRSFMLSFFAAVVFSLLAVGCRDNDRKPPEKLKQVELQPVMARINARSI